MRNSGEERSGGACRKTRWPPPRAAIRSWRPWKGSPGCHFVTAPMAGPGRRQSHQPLVFALLAISSHKPGKTASGTTSSRAKRRGVAEVTIARGRLRREMQDPTGMGPRLRSCCCHGASRRSRAPLRVPRLRDHCSPRTTPFRALVSPGQHRLRRRAPFSGTPTAQSLL